MLDTDGNYLRVRGEYTKSYSLRFAGKELPPRARRILSWTVQEILSHGTTSACAENTGNLESIQQKSVNYLRVRGEYSAVQVSATPFWELPPRARRIPMVFIILLCLLGTTSACAENTSTKLTSQPFLRNYLRVRGEYWRNARRKSRIVELPPRARRIPWRSVHEQSPHRTTSACAENT